MFAVCHLDSGVVSCLFVCVCVCVSLCVCLMVCDLETSVMRSSGPDLGFCTTTAIFMVIFIELGKMPERK